MKVAFFSNFLNHHQLPMCLAFENKENVEFTFIATEKVPKERLDMKYEDMNEKYPFVIRAYESEKAKIKALQLAENADVVIIGSAPGYYIEKRLKCYNKLTFRFCERSLKKGTWRRFIPRTRRKIKNDYMQYANNNYYILGSSAYTSHDLVICGFPEEKCFKWGYFPEVSQITNFQDVLDKKKKNSIIWVARFIELKHPEVALDLAKRLDAEGIDFSLKMIGDGPLREKYENFAKENNLSDNVEFLGALTPDEVRTHMMESEVLLFSSDFREGWGAVLNEAMNSLCVPVVSHSCGSSAFLVEQGQNGFIYQFGNNTEAFEHVKWLFQNENERKIMSEKAYKTMIEQWNATVAVDRFLELSTQLLNKGNSKKEIVDGPCSLAPVYKNNWYKG